MVSPAPGSGPCAVQVCSHCPISDWETEKPKSLGLLRPHRETSVPWTAGVMVMVGPSGRSQWAGRAIQCPVRGPHACRTPAHKVWAPSLPRPRPEGPPNPVAPHTDLQTHAPPSCRLPILLLINWCWLLRRREGLCCYLLTTCRREGPPFPLRREERRGQRRGKRRREDRGGEGGEDP